MAKRKCDSGYRATCAVDREETSSQRNPAGAWLERMSKRRRTQAALRRTAYHEAGHAVAGRVLGMMCGRATIVPDFDAMEAGFTITEDPWKIDSAWETRGKYRASVSVFRGRIMSYMARA